MMALVRVLENKIPHHCRLTHAAGLPFLLNTQRTTFCVGCLTFFVWSTAYGVLPDLLYQLRKNSICYYFNSCLRPIYGRHESIWLKVYAFTLGMRHVCRLRNSLRALTAIMIWANPGSASRRPASFVHCLPLPLPGHPSIGSNVTGTKHFAVPAICWQHLRAFAIAVVSGQVR